jgi:hypothetical protein
LSVFAAEYATEDVDTAIRLLVGVGGTIALLWLTHSF